MNLDREEYIEQAYFFRVLRERLAANLPAQEVLQRIDQEILAITRLPLAIQFLATELKHSGLLSPGFARLGHYFTPYQTFVVRCTEDERCKFSTDAALLVLEREAVYRAGQPTRPGLFVYQFEVLSRNRLGYDDGLRAMAADPFYDPAWSEFLRGLGAQVGLTDFADLVFLRSDFQVMLRRRQQPDYEPPQPVLFGEKEGKIARANSGRDPLYLFAALQRQLAYPEVPRPRSRDDLPAKVEKLQNRIKDMEGRLRLLEQEVKGSIDLTQLGKPELLQEWPKDDE